MGTLVFELSSSSAYGYIYRRVNPVTLQSKCADKEKQ